MDALVGELIYLHSTRAFIQPVQGCSPLHLVFLRLHSLQALTTLRRLRRVLSTGNALVAITLCCWVMTIKKSERKRRNKGKGHKRKKKRAQANGSDAGGAKKKENMGSLGEQKDVRMCFR